MGSKRNFSVDALRLTAAFGVILIHLAPSTPAAEALTKMFSLFAVPFFLAISLYFFLRKVRELPAVRLADLRLDRIAVPYAAWTAIYTLLRVLKFRMQGRPASVDLPGTLLFGGAAVHLYFLPLLLLLQALALALLLWFKPSRYRVAAAAVGLGAVAFGGAASAGEYFGFHQALQRGVLYVALALLLDRAQTGTTGRMVNLAVGLLTVACIVCTPLLGYPLDALNGVFQGPVVGYGICALALNLRLPSGSAAFRWLLTCSYGIYLAHFAFLEVCELAAKKRGLVLTPYSVGTKLVLAGLIGLACVAFIALARLHRLPAYLLLGESLRTPASRPAAAATAAAPA